MTDFRQKILENARTQSKYLQKYQSTLKGQQVNGNFNEDGLVSMDLQFNKDVPNPTIQLKNEPVDYDWEAMKKLSQLLKNTDSTDKTKKIVQQLINLDVTYPQLLVINWRMLSDEIMKNYSGKRVTNEQQFFDFLVNRLNSYSKLQGNVVSAVIPPTPPIPNVNNPTPTLPNWGTAPPTPVNVPQLNASSSSSSSNSVASLNSTPVVNASPKPATPIVNPTPPQSSPLQNNIVSPTPVRFVSQPVTNASQQQLDTLALMMADISNFDDASPIPSANFIEDVADGTLSLGNMIYIMEIVIDDFSNNRSGDVALETEINNVTQYISSEFSANGIDTTPVQPNGIVNPYSANLLSAFNNAQTTTPAKPVKTTIERIDKVFTDSFYNNFKKEDIVLVINSNDPDIGKRKKEDLQNVLNLQLADYIDNGQLTEFDDAIVKMQNILAPKGGISSNKQKGIKKIRDNLMSPAPTASKTGKGMNLRKKCVRPDSKYTIDMKKLGAGLLSVRYTKSRSILPFLKEQFITPQQRDIIYGMIKGEFDHTAFNKLSKQEQLLIRKLIRHFRMDVNVDDDDSLYERWNVVKQMLMNGHDGYALKQEAKTFLQTFRDLGLITNIQMLKYYNDLSLN